MPALTRAGYLLEGPNLRARLNFLKAQTEQLLAELTEETEKKEKKKGNE